MKNNQANFSTSSQKPDTFKIVKPYEGFRIGQVVYQYKGPTYGVDVPEEVSITVAPNCGPFVGLTPDHLERLPA